MGVLLFVLVVISFGGLFFRNIAIFLGAGVLSAFLGLFFMGGHYVVANTFNSVGYFFAPEDDVGVPAGKLATEGWDFTTPDYVLAAKDSYLNVNSLLDEDGFLHLDLNIVNRSDYEVNSFRVECTVYFLLFSASDIGSAFFNLKKTYMQKVASRESITVSEISNRSYGDNNSILSEKCELFITNF